MSSRLVPPWPENGHASCKFFSASRHSSAFTTEEYRASSFFSAEEDYILRKTALVCDAYRNGKERHIKTPERISFPGMATLKYQHRLGAEFFAERAAEIAHRNYAVLMEPLTLPQALPVLFSVQTTFILCSERRLKSF